MFRTVPATSVYAPLGRPREDWADRLGLADGLCGGRGRLDAR